MNSKDSTSAATLALALILGSSLQGFANNPPTPVPINKVLQPISVKGGPPAPVQPCWQISGGKATFYWPGAPLGAIWFGPVPICGSTAKPPGRARPSGIKAEEPPPRSLQLHPVLPGTEPAPATWTVTNRGLPVPVLPSRSANAFFLISLPIRWAWAPVNSPTTSKAKD